MKKILIISILFTSAFTSWGQANKSTFKNWSPKKEEWVSLLEKFPVKKVSFLDSLSNVKYLKDTISVELLIKFLWNDTTKVLGKLCEKCPQRFEYFIPKSIYKGEDFIFPVGSIPELFDKIFTTTKNGIDCHPSRKTYPLGKIRLPNENTMILYSYPEMGEGYYIVTLFILDKEYQKVGHFGFLYSANWRHCDDTMEEIMKNSQPLSYPTQITENGFVLHDYKVGSYYNDTVQEQFWTVEIRSDGKFEITKEEKKFEDGQVELWSKRGYIISDIDGYANLREKPFVTSNIIEKLLNGDKLEILDASKEWWRVKSVRGLIGYVYRSKIKEKNK